MDPAVEAILAAWRSRFPNNSYAWPGAPEAFAIEAVKAISKFLSENIEIDIPHLRIEGKRS